jgi:GWxTD domain-containing protein
MKSIIVVLILLGLALYAQTENMRRSPGLLPVFYYDALCYRSSQPEKTRVDFYVEVPYKVIQFIKSSKGFTANYSVDVSIFDESNEKLIMEKRWNETINSKDFETTLSQTNHYISLKSFELIPQKYLFRCEVEDQDSKKNFIRQEEFTVKNISGPVAISDVLLIDRRIDVESVNKIIPNVTRIVTNKKEGLSLYFEVYSDTSRDIQLEYILTNSDNEKIYSNKVVQSLLKNNNQIYGTLKNNELNIGEYKLAINILDNNEKVLTSNFKTFFSKWMGVPGSVKNVEKAVDQMMYIAKDAELSYIKDAPNKDEKLKRFLDFWKAKDPSPNTEENEVFEEYYRRIEYSNEHFKHYIEGWRTDMGMVYVTLGPPNNVERHPFEYDSKPYEVWQYYDINRSFIFVDETGFGDYRLINPEYGSWWRYRQ